MIKLDTYYGKTIAILGLGKTGVAAAEALVASGATPVIWDDNSRSLEQLPAPLAQYVKPLADWDWAALHALLLSPGIPLTHPAPHSAVLEARAHKVPITSDIELLCEAQPDATYVAITGTNGKSTTTALIGHILNVAGKSVQVGGNIGTPALAMEPLDVGAIYVLELSSYQLDLLPNTHFNIAVWLNISPDHLDRHGDMEGYIEAKKRIFAGQGPDDIAVIGVDDPYSEAVAHQLVNASFPQVVPVSVTHPCSDGVWVKDGTLQNQLEHLGANLNAFEALHGAHNHQNAAAAYAACRALGLSHDAILGGMFSFGGLAHRMQRVGQRDGVIFINDSKATNADAAARSLGSFDDIYWIAGGVAKEGGIESLATFFHRIAKTFLIGEAQDAFAKTLKGHVNYERCDSLHSAVLQAYAAAKAQGGVVLLAPACASFDMFANFEQRGEAFCAAVEEIVDN